MQWSYIEHVRDTYTWVLELPIISSPVCVCARTRVFTYLASYNGNYMYAITQLSSAGIAVAGINTCIFY